MTKTAGGTFVHLAAVAAMGAGGSSTDSAMPPAALSPCKRNAAVARSLIPSVLSTCGDAYLQISRMPIAELSPL